MGVVTEPVHPGAIITKKNWELLSTGKFHRVPLIVGFTSNETAILASLPGTYLTETSIVFKDGMFF